MNPTCAECGDPIDDDGGNHRFCDGCLELMREEEEATRDDDC